MYTYINFYPKLATCGYVWVCACVYMNINI